MSTFRMFAIIIVAGTIQTTVISYAVDADIETQDIETEINTTTNISNTVEERSVKLRDPFWPVGYIPSTETNVVENVETQEEVSQPDLKSDEMKLLWDEAQGEIKFSGLSSAGDGHYYSIINNQMIEQGDTLSIKHKGYVFCWKVKMLDKNGVKLERTEYKFEEKE